MRNYTKLEKIKLLFISYSLIFVSGIAVALPMVVKSSVSANLNINLSTAGSIFASFMLGVLTMQLLNGYVIKYISIKKEIYLISTIYLLCIISMYLFQSISVLILILLLLGFGFGAITTIPFYIITNSFSGHKRSVMMNLLDLFFAIGSFCFPILAGQLLARHFDWKILYAIVLIVWVFIIIVLTKTKLPDVNHNQTESGKNPTAFSKWTINVYLIGLAIFFAFTSFMGFNYWIVEYLTKYMGMNIKIAALGTSFFWAFYGAGCFLASIILVKMKVNRYIMISASIAFASYILIFFANSETIMLISVSLLGVGCSCIYGSSISFGTLLLENPSPRLVSFFITSSGIGTYAGEFYSSYIQEFFGVPTVIFFSSIFMLIVFIIIAYVSFIERNKTNNFMEF